MILFPAIDLKDGVCVRLEQGDMSRATVFHRDPAAQALAFEAQGFEYLHIVDLDGAFAGKPINAAAVDRILDTVAIPIQLGGGIRDSMTVEAWLEKGINRVIIGTAAVRDPALVRYAARKFPDRIAVGPQGLHAYFVHSFHLKADERSDLVAEADYGGPVTAVVARDTVVGTQFHPEKSQRLGLKLIANFLQWKP